MTQLLCFYSKGDNLGGVYHDSGGHGSVHVDLEPGTLVGGVHHSWRLGVSCTSDLFSWKTPSHTS